VLTEGAGAALDRPDLDNQLTGGTKVVSLTHWLVSLYPPEIFLVPIYVRGWVDPRDVVHLEGLGLLRNPMTSGIEPMTIQLVA
jgi:hypothetical protein